MISLRDFLELDLLSNGIYYEGAISYDESKHRFLICIDEFIAWIMIIYYLQKNVS